MTEELVVDAAAAAEALIRKDAVGTVLARRIRKAHCHAPHLIDAEVGQVLRRTERLGVISEETALTELLTLSTMIEERYVHTGWLAADAWELRKAVTFYDGLYVALAARLDLPLLTGDVKLSKAPDLPCRVELIS